MFLCVYNCIVDIYKSVYVHVYNREMKKDEDYLEDEQILTGDWMEAR